MALTFNLDKFVSNAPTGLSVTPAGGLGALISWDPVAAGDQVEVYWNNTNNSGTATKVATTQDKVFVDKDFDNSDAGANNYYWLKRIQKDGKASSFTSPSSVSISAITAEVAPTSSVGSDSGYSGSAGSGSYNATGYGSWEETPNYYQFSSSTNNTIYVANQFYATIEIGAVSGGSITNAVRSYLRFRLRDMTDSADVQAHTFEYFVHEAFNGGTWVETFKLPIINNPMVIQQGALSPLIPGHTYRLIMDIKRERVVGTTQTYSYSIMGNCALSSMTFS